MNQVNNKGPSDSFRQLWVDGEPISKSPTTIIVPAPAVTAQCSSPAPQPTPASSPDTPAQEQVGACSPGKMMVPQPLGACCAGQAQPACWWPWRALHTCRVTRSGVQQGEQPADGNTGDLARVGTPISVDRRKRAFLLPPPQPAGNLPLAHG